MIYQSTLHHIPDESTFTVTTIGTSDFAQYNFGL
jgi:hypothetical protein